MSEKRILIASLLKPINDTRMFEKLGLSLSKLSGVQVHIIGYKAPLPPAPTNVFFHPAFNFERVSLSRLTAQRTYKQLLENIKPDLLIACTHELLAASRSYCLKYGAKLMYDVQENYALNLTSQRNYPLPARAFLANLVRKTEKKTAPFISHFLLAERSYAQELPFLAKGKYKILENKYKPNARYDTPATPVSLANGPLKLLYSGTIATLYGVFEAVSLAEQLHDMDASISLTIIGYSPDKQTLKHLISLIQGKPFIRLVGGNQLVPHEQILQLIRESHVGLLPYQPNPSTERCIPTKLYEYMAYALPMLVQHNSIWQSILAEKKAGLMIDFKTERPSDILLRIRQQDFYTSGIPQNIYWEHEELKLLEIIKSALTDC
ncbi:glycosyltransferase [Pontibacter oryzae]|uniref:Glycosyltransferase n=1 Tax=Pontibacter oryzae TaxID=2304593 RepID=A0A399SCM2_9BACT|nr:glycosyltransferase [Pontibacter oryzae]RIJ41826.1 glycosyltransferase [Pontibacter oryzae]